jgi:hypothetical protein
MDEWLFDYKVKFPRGGVLKDMIRDHQKTNRAGKLTI